MADDEWASNSTEATTISTWQPGQTSPSLVSEFKPNFTYPVFGDEESIFGYKNLDINIDFAAHDLLPNISWSYGKIFKSVGDTQALDLRDALADFTVEGAFRKRDKYLEQIQEKDGSSFTPPGEKVRAWSKNGQQYEIWSGSLMDPTVRELLDRAQILVSLFIEGGTHLELDDQEWTVARWRVFFVYEKLSRLPTQTCSAYSFVGYATSYRFLTFTANSASTDEQSQQFQFPPESDIDVTNLPYRGRISQFLVLPPFAHQGHGSMLYATIFKHFLDDPSCIEITVEDPNEAFDDLRDYCDFTRLLQNGTLERIRMNHNIDPKLTMHAPGRKLPTSKLVDKELLALIRRENKLAQRQFARLIELWLLSRIPAHSRQAGTARLTKKAKSTDEGDRAMYFWRLLIKQRVYKQNRDKLIDVEQSEVVDHLEETTNNLLVDYERLLASLASKAVSGAANEVEDPSTSQPVPRRGKRNLVIDDDEDENESDSRSKRSRSVAKN